MLRIFNSYPQSLLAVLVFTGTLFNAELYAIPDVNLSDSDQIHTERATNLFQKALDGIWAYNISAQNMLLLLDRAEAACLKIQNPAMRNFYLAQVELYRGRIVVNSTEKSRGRNRVKARKHFESALSLARASLDSVESSEGYRVMADAGASWMLTKGLFGLLSMAPKMKEWTDKALVLDPQNALAMILNAQRQINAPKSAGGNPEKALLHLNQLLQRNDLTDIERFWALVSVSEAHQKLNQKVKASGYIEEAKRIFPNNPLVLENPESLNR